MWVTSGSTSPKSRLATEHYASRKNKYVKWYGKGI